jgi:hypothetical protein
MEISDSALLTEKDKHILQCTVMKIAKASKTISAAHFYQLIMNEWKRTTQLSFPQIGDCIKLLQEKNFLEFDEAQSVFRYIP